MVAIRAIEKIKNLLRTQLYVNCFLRQPPIKKRRFFEIDRAFALQVEKLFVDSKFVVLLWATGGKGAQECTHIEEVERAIAGKISDQITSGKGTQECADIEEVECAVPIEIGRASRVAVIRDIDDLHTRWAVGEVGR